MNAGGADNRSVLWNVCRWFVIVMAVFLLVGGVALYVYEMTRSHAGRARTREQIPEQLRRAGQLVLANLLKGIPDGAKDIDYQVMPYAGNFGASYSISEKRFLEWMAKRGREPRRVTRTRPVAIVTFLYPSSEGVTIWQGYHWENQVASQYMEIAYDRQSERAYYFYTNRASEPD